jgi:peptide/nickel transport system ATP-binding protein
MVFQDPYGSLDPRMAVRRIVAEPLSVAEPSLTRAERRQRVEAALAAVGLKPADADKYPHEFSGGQRQRLAIARALITRPKLIVADEPVSALDVSVQAQVLNLMLDLAEDHGVTYLFISHNLMVVEHVCERLAVMYLGRVVETGDAAEIFARPAHPYTRALIDAAPSLTPTAKGERIRLDELGVAATGEGRGCAFADRCPRAEARCRVEEPALRQVAPDRQAACHFA